MSTSKFKRGAKGAAILAAVSALVIAPVASHARDFVSEMRGIVNSTASKYSVPIPVEEIRGYHRNVEDILKYEPRDAMIDREEAAKNIAKSPSIYDTLVHASGDPLADQAQSSPSIDLNMSIDDVFKHPDTRLSHAVPSDAPVVESEIFDESRLDNSVRDEYPTDPVISEESVSESSVTEQPIDDSVISENPVIEEEVEDSAVEDAVENTEADVNEDTTSNSDTDEYPKITESNSTINDTGLDDWLNDEPSSPSESEPASEQPGPSSGDVTHPAAPPAVESSDHPQSDSISEMLEEMESDEAPDVLDIVNTTQHDVSDSAPIEESLPEYDGPVHLVPNNAPVEEALPAFDGPIHSVPDNAPVEEALPDYDMSRVELIEDTTTHVDVEHSSSENSVEDVEHTAAGVSAVEEVNSTVNDTANTHEVSIDEGISIDIESQKTVVSEYSKSLPKINSTRSYSGEVISIHPSTIASQNKRFTEQYASRVNELRGKLGLAPVSVDYSNMDEHSSDLLLHLSDTHRAGTHINSASKEQIRKDVGPMMESLLPAQSIHTVKKITPEALADHMFKLVCSEYKYLGENSDRDGHLRQILDARSNLKIMGGIHVASIDQQPGTGLMKNVLMQVYNASALVLEY